MLFAMLLDGSVRYQVAPDGDGDPGNQRNRSVQYSTVGWTCTESGGSKEFRVEICRNEKVSSLHP